MSSQAEVNRLEALEAENKHLKNQLKGYKGMLKVNGQALTNSPDPLEGSENHAMEHLVAEIRKLSDQVEELSRLHTEEPHYVYPWEKNCPDCGRPNPIFKDEEECSDCGFHLGAKKYLRSIEKCPKCYSKNAKSVEPRVLTPSQ